MNVVGHNVATFGHLHESAHSWGVDFNSLFYSDLFDLMRGS